MASLSDNQRLALAKVRQLYRDMKTLKAVAYELELTPATISRYLHRKVKPNKIMSYWILLRI